MNAAPLVAHVIHELHVGGLENGLVNLINHSSRDRYRHAIVCMTRYTEFRQRIRGDDVQVYALNRDTQRLWKTYLALYRLFRTIRPSIVHTRNLSGLDALIPAALAGVAVRIHGEHGRDMLDLDGSNVKYRRLKRAFRPWVTHFTAVSKDLQTYLIRDIGVPEGRVTQIYNGVDTGTFFPDDPTRRALDSSTRVIRIGTIGRLQPVKDQVTLIRAFAEAHRSRPDAMRVTELAIVGEGPSRAELEQEIARSGVSERIGLLGQRDDVPQQLRSMDLFVLPSLAEGISNTILEALATGIPVIATSVGGNPELIEHDAVGRLVAPRDVAALASALVDYVESTARRERHGLAARNRALNLYSIDAMVDGYLGLYDRLLRRPSHRPTRVGAVMEINEPENTPR